MLSVTATFLTRPNTLTVLLEYILLFGPKGSTKREGSFQRCFLCPRGNLVNKTDLERQKNNRCYLWGRVWGLNRWLLEHSNIRQKPRALGPTDLEYTLIVSSWVIN